MIEKASAWLRTRLAAAGGLEGEEGQDFAEYALLLALIVVVAAAALTPLGGAIRDAFESVRAQL